MVQGAFMRITQTVEYADALREGEQKFDDVEKYALQVQDFIVKHGARNLMEPHVSTYKAAKTYIGWRENKKIRRSLVRSAKKWARNSLKKARKAEKHDKGGDNA